MALPPHDQELLRALQTRIDQRYLQALRGARTVVLLDQPDHRNLGDTLIWRGELDTFRRLGVRVAYRATLRSARWSEIQRLPQSWPIVFHGGGNFGDVYEQHLRHREEAFHRLAPRHFVFLPQSAHFNKSENIAPMRDLLARGGEISLLMRNEKSFQFAQKHFGDFEVIHCPDSALGIHAQESPKFLAYRPSRPQRVFLAARQDIESRGGTATLRPGDREGDWPFTLRGRVSWRMARDLLNAPLGALPDGLIRDTARNTQSRLYERLNLSAFLPAIDGAGAVATDRLHMHVFCCLAGIPHVAADNNTGKVSSIYEEYTGAFSTAHWGDSVGDAYLKAVAITGGSTSEHS